MLHLLFLAAENVHGAAHAPQPGVADVNWLPAVTAMLVFGVVFFILATKVWPKINQALADREQKILDEIRSAEAAREQAKAALAEYETNLSRAREEAQQMIAKARADAKAAAEELRSRNQAELADMKARATQEIESAKQSAIAELHAEATVLAASMAGKILQREITPEDQQRLVEDSLDQFATHQGV